MKTLLILLCLALLMLIIVQISKVRELAAGLRGEEEIEARRTNVVGYGLLFFMVAFLVLTLGTALVYKNYYLGYGPHESASAGGAEIDSMFHSTLLITYIVFVVTHILLFWYAFKFRYRKERKAQFISHNNMVEVVWTVIPAIVLSFLVIKGLDGWNRIMGDVGSDEEFVEIEATGYQFAWQMRYPGADGLLGRKDFRLIGGANQLGQDWEDRQNLDDVLLNDVYLAKGRKVRVRITARDVLHDFYLPQFRVKMDAVPGLPTYFVFTPTKTTEEWRQGLSQYPEYQVPDPEDPSKQLWETINMELACAELCGIGHWSMKRNVYVMEPEEYDRFMAEQQSFYMGSIRGTADDPWTDELFPEEIAARSEAFNGLVDAALETEDTADDTFVLEHLKFQTGSAELTTLSRYQIADVVSRMENDESLTILLGGHTDATGDADANMALSISRAEAVYNAIIAGGIDAGRLGFEGYGQTRPIDTNDTDAGRANNRRTEITVRHTANL
ncbi:MAG: OmpA family protein [Bacteroidota bacterium]